MFIFSPGPSQLASLPAIRTQNSAPYQQLIDSAAPELQRIEQRIEQKRRLREEIRIM
jgi:hypothetical protein